MIDPVEPAHAHDASVTMRSISPESNRKCTCSLASLPWIGPAPLEPDITTVVGVEGRHNLGRGAAPRIGSAAALYMGATQSPHGRPAQPPQQHVGDVQAHAIVRAGVGVHVRVVGPSLPSACHAAWASFRRE